MELLTDACRGTSYHIAATPHCFACYIFSKKSDPRIDIKKYGIEILEGHFFGLPEDVTGGRFNLANPRNAELVAEKIKEINL